MRAQLAPEKIPYAARIMTMPMISSAQPQFLTLLVIGSSPPMLRSM